MELRILSRAARETEAIAEGLGKLLTPPFVVALYGELGAGKTTFIRGLARGIGIDQVRSPTFTLINRYEGRYVLYHVDLYRIDDEDEIYHLGLTELFEDQNAITVIEWADKGYPYLPDERLDIYFELSSDVNPDERWIHLKPFGSKAEYIVKLMG